MGDSEWNQELLRELLAKPMRKEKVESDRPIRQDVQPFRWRRSTEIQLRHSEVLEIQDKARLPSTKVGKVPLRNGKYGMTAEEFLEYSKYKEGKKPDIKLESTPWEKNNYEPVD